MSGKLTSPSFVNLPTPVSTFIGREREITEVKQLILENRLVTLTGAGGSGKTRLALKVAHDLLEQFNNKVWFIEFASLTDPSLVPQKISSTLNIHDQSSRSLLDSLVNHLSMHLSLLILDNCEHLVDAFAEISEFLLQKCAGLKILTTSREVLGITGEVDWIVPPLSLPKQQPWKDPSSALNAIKQYEKSESVQLFIARATAKSPEFELTTNNCAWVAEICRRLDGMPLAIEMAAAQVRSLSVQEIAQRLDNRFQLLTGGSRTAPLRQQTLLSTLEWSYELLSRKEQRVFQRISVFAGGATLKAAEMVCMGEGVETVEVLELLSHLLDKNLITVDKPEWGETRYHMLESIREYALEKLADSNEWKIIRNRHLDFFLLFAEEAESKLKGPDELVWYPRLEVEHNNLRTALRWALESQNAEAGLRLAGSLSLFWWIYGHLREGIDWLEKVLENPQGASSASYAKALRFLGGLLSSSEEQDSHKISKLFEKSLEIYRELDDRSGIAWILNQIGINSMLQGKYKKAKQLYEESLSLRIEIGDPWSIAQTLQNFAPILLRQNDYTGAREFSESTITWFQKAGYQRGIVRTSMDLAEIARMEGDSARANEILTKALPQLMELGDPLTFAYALESLAALSVEQSELNRAALLFGTTEALREAIGIPRQDSEYPNYEKDVDIVQNGLSEKKFNQVWAKGRTMSLEQIVDFVIHHPEIPTDDETQNENLGGLTTREREAAILIAEGKSNREIAEAMTVTVKTVEAYVTRILRKLGFDSRVQIATWVIDKDLS